MKIATSCLLPLTERGDRTRPSGAEPGPSGPASRLPQGDPCHAHGAASPHAWAEQGNISSVLSRGKKPVARSLSSSRLQRFSLVSHTKSLVPTLCVGMPSATLRVVRPPHRPTRRRGRRASRMAFPRRTARHDPQVLSVSKASAFLWLASARPGALCRHRGP